MRVFAIVGILLGFAGTGRAAKVPCRTGEFALSDARAIAGVRGALADACPCATFDGTSKATGHGAFVRCARGVIKDASDDTALFGTYALRRECRKAVQQTYATAACGFSAEKSRVMCCERKAANGKTRGVAKPAAACVADARGKVARTPCPISPFAPDACRFDDANRCTAIVRQETVDIASEAAPANTPGSPGVTVTNEKLLTQFGGPSFTLNRARYTRHALAGADQTPDAILLLVPGFEGGAGDFDILADQLIARAEAANFALEVWAIDRRTNQLEDLAGLDLAEQYLDPQIALDWLYGGELTLPLHSVLAAGPNRRGVFYDTQADVPFLAAWTNLVFSRDIDAIVAVARSAARNANVFLGGHSAGTGFTARYAATDFNLSGTGDPDPGYAKLRGLVLLEGGGGSTSGTPLTDDSLDRIEAKFDGGLFGAVRDNAPRCVDGTTACTVATEAADCAGQLPPKCTPPTTAYAVVPGLLNPRILSAGEVTAIQSVLDPDGTETVVRVDQGSPGNNAVEVVPDLASLALLPRSTAFGGLGSFLDDDGAVATLASFVATSLGAPGPMVDGLQTWLDLDEGPFAPEVVPNNGPTPTALPAGRWGQEHEVTRLDRMARTFYEGGTNFTDLYYPTAGPSVTSVSGVCTSGVCSVGNVGASCAADGECSQSVGLDSTALSVGRGRRDIENLTQASAIDIPVLGVGGTNGLVTTPGAFIPFASSIGPCATPGCDGTARVVDAALPNPAFPTFGGTPGGFEIVIAEGFAHVDVLTAEDDARNPIPAALVDFLMRHAQ